MGVSKRQTSKVVEAYAFTNNAGRPVNIFEEQLAPLPLLFCPIWHTTPFLLAPNVSISLKTAKVTIFLVMKAIVEEMVFFVITL